jgi:hypothetical protein
MQVDFFNINKKPVGLDLRIEGHELERVEEIKDLGVILDTKMSFLSHVETIISKSAKMLGFIKRILSEFNDQWPFQSSIQNFKKGLLEEFWGRAF